jgi:pSer/pThr/pTyr-binding forkhead associated (FHA) protein
MGVTLRCTVGPCLGQAIAVESELLLGREEPDPGSLGGDARLSRRHARISFDEHGRAVVEDLGSTNGTWINEERLSAPHVCVTGDVLRVGQSTFQLEVAPPPAARTEPDMVAPRAAPTVAEMPAPAPVLQVTEGARRGEEIPLDHELLIGRTFGEPGALGGDRRLSRRHARIARGPGGVFFIEDTGSANGTRVNGSAVLRPRALRDADEIEVGSTTLVAHGLPAVPVSVEAAESMPMPPSPVAAPHAPSQPGAVHQAPPQPAPPQPASPPPASPVTPLPVPSLHAPPPPPGAQPHFLPQGAAGTRLSSRRGRVIGLFAAVFVASAVIAVAVVVLAAPLGSRSCPDGFICHPPPTAPPLQAATTFTGALGWHVEYDTQRAKTAEVNAAGNELILQDSNAFDHLLGAAPNSNLIRVVLRGYPSSRTSPTAAENGLISEFASHLVGTATAPSSDQFFTRPALGFHPAVGKVVEGNAQTPQGPGPLVKVAVMSAASGGVTIVMGIVYLIQRGQTQGENPNRPLDEFSDEVVGTVRFPGDGAG